MLKKYGNATELSVTVPKLKRRLVKGDAGHFEYLPTEVHVLDVRAENLLRKSPPSLRVKRGTDDAVRPPQGDDVKKAAKESAYTGVPALALSGPEASDPGEGVGDWEDMGRTERKVVHLKDREAVRAEDDTKRQRKAAKATLDATLAGLTPENQQILLAQIISQCEAAKSEKAA